MEYVFFIIVMIFAIYSLLKPNLKPNDTPFDRYANSTYYRLLIIVIIVIILTIGSIIRWLWFR